MKYTVMMESEEFGREFFTYETMAEALAGIGRLHDESTKLDDGVERVIGLVLNHTEDPMESPSEGVLMDYRREIHDYLVEKGEREE